MEQNGIASRRQPRQPRRWTRVEPARAYAPERVEGTTGTGEHHFVVYDARVVRCSCGATLLATDPAVLRAPADSCDIDTIAMHAAWCEKLELGDFSVRALPAPIR